MKNMKCVIVIDRELPLGLIANTAAILGCSLNHYVEDVVGPEIADGNGYVHKGVINVPLPILSSDKEELKRIYKVLIEEYNEKITLIGFNDIAQSCKDYSDYTQKLSCTNLEDLNYLGFCIYGDKKIINSFTGSMPTLK